MKSPKDNVSEEDNIPSDFFDDFNKEEFMEGLSVIDSWEVKEGKQTRSSRSRIIAEALDGVQDLRELIGDSREDRRPKEDKVTPDQNKKVQPRDTSSGRHSDNSYRNSSQLDKYIKPGSRRDLRKTNEAIKRDKEVKVKEYLSKHLHSIEDLKPPGTELDDFLNDTPSKRKARSRSPEIRHSQQSSPSDPKFLKSPKRDHFKDKKNYYSARHCEYKNQRGQPYFKPTKYHHQSPNSRIAKNLNKYSRQSDRSGHSPGPQRTSRHSPVRYSPHRRSPYRRSPYRRSPRRHSPRRNSPRRHSPRRNSPRRHSPRRHSPHRYSPRRQSPRWRSRSQSSRSSKYKYSDKSACLEHKDSFLYPNDLLGSGHLIPLPNSEGQTQGEFYPNAHLTEYSAHAPGYTYMQNTTYSCARFDYGAQTDSLNLGLEPQVNPAPVMNTTPSMVPAPPESSAAVPISVPTSNEKPYDALAKLVVEGKLTKEDYLKLAPNKGAFVEKAVATQVRVKVLDRCLQALAKLSKLEIPNRLFLNNALIDQETKSLTPKYCSPLKRQAPVDFYFTKTNSESSTVQQNKQVIDNIISTIGLSDIVLRSKKKSNKNMADAAVQTMNPFCDVCHIRESTKTYDAETSIDHEDFTATVHTQVVDEDLLNSKSVFNPCGGVTSHEPVSIAHLTPAQLVSQLAARAKTLKQSHPQRSQFNRRTPGSNYDYGGSGSNDVAYFKK